MFTSTQTAALIFIVMFVVVLPLVLWLLTVIERVRPTHYVRLDMVDLSLTTKEYRLLLASGEIRYPLNWTPCVRGKTGWIVVNCARG